MRFIAKLIKGYAKMKIMQNRLKSYRFPNIGENFSSFSVFSNINLFIGTLDAEKFVSKFIENKLEEAKKEGFQKAIDRLEINIRKGIDNYISLVTRIVDFIHREIDKETEKDLKIIETRTNFYFGTNSIKALFIIDSKLDDEMYFSNFLNKVEHEVFSEENFICELFYINKRNAKLDKPSIATDYPFIRKINPET